MSKQVKKPEDAQRFSRRGSGMQLFRHPEVDNFDVVTVADLPLTRRESTYDSIVRYVHSLPKGTGIRLRNRNPQDRATGRATAIRSWSQKIGKPVATQVRSAGGERGQGDGYQIWVFKRTDFVMKRNGHAQRV